MQRYVLIDSELNEIMGDTDRFFLRYLRVAAFVLGAALPSEGIDLTATRAAEILDVVTGDNIGWHYVEHPADFPPVGAGYEVYEIPRAERDAGRRFFAEAGDPVAVSKIRTEFQRVAFIEKSPVH